MIRDGQTGRQAPAAGPAGGVSFSRLPLAVVAGAAIGLAASLPVKPLYVADARVIVRAGSPFSAPADAAVSGVVESQAAILQSRELALKVIDRHDLSRALDPAGDGILFDTILSLAGLRSNPGTLSPKDRALARFEERLAVSPVGHSRVIEIRYADADPALAARVVNAVADTFIADHAMSQDSADRSTADWLKTEIGRLEERVAEADRRLERHRSGVALRQIITGSAASGTAPQDLEHLRTELAQARAENAQARARAGVIRALLKQGSSVDAARDVLDSPLVRTLREQQIRLQTQKAELSSTYLPDHPRIEALQAQLSDLDRQIRTEIGKALKSIELSAEIAAARVKALEASVEELNAAVPPVVNDEAELKALEYDARSQRELLETFMTRFRTLSAADGPSAAAPGARIISRAKTPTGPSRPNRWLWAAGGALTALAILLFSAARSRRSSPFVAAADGGAAADPHDPPHRSEAEPEPGPEAAAEPAVDLPEAEVAQTESLEIEEMPEERAIEALREIVAQANPSDPPREPDTPSAYEILVGAPGTKSLAGMLRQDAVRTVLFAGSAGNRTHDALALAVASVAASGGLRSIVIDIGLRPSDLLSPDDGRPGLGELISGVAKFRQVISHDVLPGVDAIAMGRARGNPPLARLAAVIESLAGRYASVIVVADEVGDWPDGVVRPDLAVIAYDPVMQPQAKRRLFEDVMRRGAGQAVLVRDEISGIGETARQAA